MHEINNTAGARAECGREAMKRWEHERTAGRDCGGVIEALKVVQKQRGWVPDGAIRQRRCAGYSGERRPACRSGRAAVSRSVAAVMRVAWCPPSPAIRVRARWKESRRKPGTGDL